MGNPQGYVDTAYCKDCACLDPENADKPDPKGGWASYSYKGDGYCDDGNNHAGCDFDGGDCCPATVGEVKKFFCSACACLDPSAKNATALPLLGSAAKKKQWLEVGANLECDGYNGEVY